MLPCRLRKVSLRRPKIMLMCSTGSPNRFWKSMPMSPMPRARMSTMHTVMIMELAESSS